jgi:DNA-directed RNA polymerase specialized sigma24 family protein
MSAESSASSIFPRTDRAELGRAGEADESRLDRLIRAYWAPLRVFLLASFPSLKDQADLLLQDFTEDKILKRGWLQRADRRRGKFRDFLKTSLRNFVLDRLDRAEFKRAPVSLEELAREPAAAEAPSEAFDLTWARTVVAQLRHPQGLAMDNSGRLYVAETDNLAILPLTGTGAMATLPVAGDLGHPDAIAVDALGNLYVSDTIHNVIRKVTLRPLSGSCFCAITKSQNPPDRAPVSPDGAPGRTSRPGSGAP